MICEACATTTTAPLPAANSLSRLTPGGANCTREAASGLSESSRILRTRAALFSLSAITAIFFFFRSATVLIFLSPGLSISSTSWSRIATARAREGTLASVRRIARLASLRSNDASALALSPWGMILSRSRDVLLFSSAASLAAKRASGPLASPTANTSVSEFRSQVRPPHTVTAVRIKVRTENSTICVRLLFTTRERRRGISGCGVGASALMAHTRSGRLAVKPASQTVLMIS